MLLVTVWCARGPVTLGTRVSLCDTGGSSHAIDHASSGLSVMLDLCLESVEHAEGVAGTRCVSVIGEHSPMGCLDAGYSKAEELLVSQCGLDWEPS